MQQVNLYLPELRPKKEWLTANTVLASAIGLMVMLGVIQIIVTGSVTRFESNVIIMENQQVASASRVEKLKNSPLSSNRVGLEQRIDQLRNAIKSREYVGLIIEDQNLGNSEGFAGAMTGLARQSSDSISLSRIRLSAGGSAVELAGEMKRPEDIPLYLQRIQTEKSFLQSRFGLLSVAQEKNSRSVHKFSLGFESLFDETVAGESL